MGKQKITIKITIWYAVFLIAISVVLMLSLTYMNVSNARFAAENKVIEAIVRVRDQIEADGKDFIYDTDLNFYQDEIYISVYNQDSELVLGRRPLVVKEDPGFEDRVCHEVKDSSKAKWYVYDNIFKIEGERYWIRGIMKDVTGSEATWSTTRYFLFLLPLLVVFALIGGYFITKRAFEPVREITRVSEEIQEDADLSRRIQLGTTHDELYDLSESINGMIDKLEGDMEREKQFSSDVSHELRTPIAIIQAQSEFAIDNPEAAVEAAEVINKQAKRMSNLVSKLLMLSRSDSGRLTLDMEKINFSEILEEIAEQQQMIVEDYDIKIETEIESDVMIEADESMLIRIILNLIDNAVKYGKNPGGTIKLSLKKDDKFAYCQVSDNGQGIPKKQQKKIWQRFYQVDQSRKDGTSSGLGLAMVHSLTKSMGGTVKLESEEGKGSTFELKFKVVHDEKKDK